MTAVRERCRLFSLKAVVIYGLVALSVVYFLITNSSSLSFRKHVPTSSPSSRNMSALRQKEYTLPICSSSKRRNTMMRQCDDIVEGLDYQNLSNYDLSSVFVDDKNKVIACVIAKAASSIWKKTMIQAVKSEKKIKDENMQNLRYLKKIGIRILSDFNAKGIRLRLNKYFKFISVRHPFSRLSSTFRDKFRLNAKTFQHQRYTDVILKRYRRNNSTLNAESPHEVSFGEFVKYLIGTEPKSFDVHWKRYEDVCFPCEIKYDYIARTETLSDDAKVILKKYALDGDSDLNHTNKLQVEQSSVQQNEYISLFDNVPKDDMQRLYRLYQRDFDLFGYHWEEEGSITKCMIGDSDSDCC